MIEWNEICRQITRVTGKPMGSIKTRPVGGGCINRCYHLSEGELEFFVKTNSASLLDMFECEAEGLSEIAATGTVRVPRPVCTGVAQRQAYLVLEYIPLGGRSNGSLAGERLAALHRHTAAQFGWQRDNHIGATPQPNSWTQEWIDFWRRHRLGFQLELAANQGHRGRLQQRGEMLLDLFPALIDHTPRPSLIHGDLWGGNLGYDQHGEPVIYDPAAYYADREAEIAMTELFGGFGSSFYRSYNQSWPLDAGYPVRRNLYNLYHILNHLHLFGGGYLGQSLGLIDSLLAELGH